MPAAPRAEGARREPPRRPLRRSGPSWSSYWPVAAVAALLVVAVGGIYLYSRSTATPTAAPSASAAAAVVDTITHTDLGQSAAVGSGGIPNPFKPTHSSSPLVGPSGHPEVLYVGAEYCPYCAAERWSLVVALSRFGTFGGLELTQSSSTDIYPNTPTLTFVKSSYQSSTLEFAATETEDRNQQPLQQLTAAQSQQLRLYDSAGSIPFVLIGGKQYETGAGFLPDNLQGHSWEEVASAIREPGSPIGKQVLGNANWITAAICQATADGAGDACTQPAIKSLEGQLAS